MMGEGEPNDRGLPKGISWLGLGVKRTSPCSWFRMEASSMFRMKSAVAGTVEGSVDGAKD